MEMGDADIENRLMDTEGVRGEEREGGTKAESNMEAYTLPCVKQITNGNLVYNSGTSNLAP